MVSVESRVDRELIPGAGAGGGGGSDILGLVVMGWRSLFTNIREWRECCRCHWIRLSVLGREVFAFGVSQSGASDSMPMICGGCKMTQRLGEKGKLSGKHWMCLQTTGF